MPQVGGEAQERSFQILRRGGKLISAVSRPDQDLAKRYGVEAAFFLVNVTSEYLTKVARFIDGGKLRTNVGAVLPLTEAREATLLLHVVDASDPRREEHIAAVDSVLTEIGANGIAQILVYNKIDRLELQPRLDRDADGRASAVWISAAVSEFGRPNTVVHSGEPMQAAKLPS